MYKAIQVYNVKKNKTKLIIHNKRLHNRMQAKENILKNQARYTVEKMLNNNELKENLGIIMPSTTNFDTNVNCMKS